MKNWETIELLRHVRHKWLNQLQLIQTYLSIGNEKRVKEIIDALIFECKQEANISNLPFHNFATFLLTYPFQNYPILLKYEVTSDGTIDHSCDEMLSNWFQQFLKKMNETVSSGEENEMHIRMEIKDRHIYFFIHFIGWIQNMKEINLFLKQASDAFTIETIRFTHDTLQLSIIV